MINAIQRPVDLIQNSVDWAFHLHPSYVIDIALLTLLNQILIAGGEFVYQV